MGGRGGEGGRDEADRPARTGQDRTGRDRTGRRVDGWNRRGGRYLGREPVVGHPLQRRWCGRVPMSLAARLTWSFSGHKSQNRQPLWRHTALPCPALPCCPRAQSGRWLLIPDTAVESPGRQHLTPGIDSILLSTSAPAPAQSRAGENALLPMEQTLKVSHGNALRSTDYCRQLAQVVTRGPSTGSVLCRSAWRPTADDSPTANVRSVPPLPRRPPNATSRTHQLDRRH